MGKAVFLKHFQNNLEEAIENLIIDVWGYEGLIVSVEDGNLNGKFDGFIDISITNPENRTSIIALEIEYLSGFEGAKRNIEKMKTWAHNSTYRKCGFLHVFNEDCYINNDQLSVLIRLAKDNERKNAGFFYDYIFYVVDDLRETRITADSLVNTKEFQIRLWMLMEDTEIIKEKR